ncbi:MAG: DinB family protein [Actinomycetota bacterium]|nr:DinB family protein [Actinomycetota bacterium]
MSQDQLDARGDPPAQADEAATTWAYLDYQRATLFSKARGLTQAQLAQPLPPSSLTLGGLLKHMALVEESWFDERFAGNPPRDPWASIDWDADPDWEFRTAADDSPETLRAMLAGSIDIARRAVLRRAMDDLSAQPRQLTGELFSLRWVALHMIEEYARHLGHADLLREAIDGQTGE